MAYSDDFAIIGIATDDFDCNAITNWTAGGTAVTPIVLNADSREGLNSIEMRGTAGVMTYTHDIGLGNGFNMLNGSLNFWLRYSKGKGASYLGTVASDVTIRLYFGGTVDWADYYPLDAPDEDLQFGWNLLQVSGTNQNGGGKSSAWTDYNREIRRVELRINLTNANDKDSEDAPILMDCWFYGTKIIIQDGTTALPETLEDVEAFSNTRTAFPLGLVNIDEVFADVKCGIEVNGGFLEATRKIILMNQWSEEVKQNIELTTAAGSGLRTGESEVGTDGTYAVRGCQITLPPNRFSDIIVNNGATLQMFDTKIFQFRDLFFGAAVDTGSTVELRRVQIDSCETAYFRANTLNLQDIEIYNNSNNTRPQCGEIIVSPDSCQNFLVHDCQEGLHFRAAVTMSEYIARDNIAFDLGVLDGVV